MSASSTVERLIRLSCEKQQIPRGQLLLHADRGTSMTSKTVAFLLSDLGVTKSHSRPHVSNDNPFSEAQPVQDPQISALLSQAVWLPSGCQSLLPAVFYLVQPGTSSWRHWPIDPRHDALGPSPNRHPATPTGLDCRFSGSS